MPTTPSRRSSPGPAWRQLAFSAAPWRSGVVVTICSAFLFPLAWRLSDPVFESQAIVALTPTDRAALEALVDEHNELHGGLLSRPHHALTLQQPTTDSALLTCRADEPEAAQRTCTELVSQLRKARPGARELRAADRPDAPMSFMDLDVLLGSLRNALLMGFLWLLAGAGVVAWRRRGERAPVPAAESQSTASAASASDAPGRGNGSGAPDENAAPEEDLLQAACRRVFLLAGDGCVVVAVTGAPDERQHKCLVAARLAAMLADGSDARVLLVEGDFEYAEIDRLLGVAMPMMAGFSQQINMRHEADQGRPWTVVKYGRLHVLAEGTIRSPAMLYSSRFNWALSSLRRHYDIIVINGPTLGRPADAQVLDEVAEAIVFASAEKAAVPAGLQLASQWFPEKRMISAVPAG